MISPYVQYATHTIPELNYSYDSLSPYLSTEAVKVHHEIIHQSYVTNLNWVIKWTDMKDIPRDSSVKDMIVSSYNNPNLKALHNNSSPHCSVYPP